MFEHDQPITTEIHLKTKNNTHTKLLLTTWDYTNDANIFHHKSFNSIKSFALSGKRYKTKIDFFLFCLIIKKKKRIPCNEKIFFFLSSLVDSTINKSSAIFGLINDLCLLPYPLFCCITYCLFHRPYVRDLRL